VRDLLPVEADELLRGRVQIVNVWRPIRGPLRDTPLAVCDARTVKPEQLVPSDLVYRNRVGETYAVAFDPRHRWFYVPEMETDEALLIKCYDSETDGRARFAPHTAFADRPRLPGRPRGRASSSGPWCSTRRRLGQRRRKPVADPTQHGEAAISAAAARRW
jgi:hypothetical protein